MSTLTREQLFSKCKPRVEQIDVDGFGKVWVKSLSQSQLSRRQSSYRDLYTGEILPGEAMNADLHLLIDQIMRDQTTPMFSEDDLDALGQLDSGQLAPLYQAIRQFNGETDQGKQPAG